MDRRSWLWRRSNSENNQSGETENLGSVSSHSERFSDDQSLSNPNAQSPEVMSKAVNFDELIDSGKPLSEKLSEAFAEIRAKEDSVKQHAKVAEEAVSGWERSENEVLVLKKQVGQLDGALKECLRQLRQAREEQEEKIYEALVNKSSEWESKKSQLENQILELHSQLQNAKSNTIERDLSTRAAEAASKQHLESLRKVAKLEAECRRLKKASSIYAESVTDCHSDYGDKMVIICENDVGQNKTTSEKCFAVPLIEIDLMDDFLEMESLIAFPDPLSGRNDDTWVNQGQNGELEGVMSRTGELEEKLMVMGNEKVNLESDLNECRIRLTSSEEQLKQTRVKLVELSTELAVVNEAKRAAEIEVEFTKVNSAKLLDETKLTVVRVQNQLTDANEAKSRAAVALNNVKVKKIEAESKVKEMERVLQNLRSRIGSLEEEVEKERKFSKCEKLESDILRMKLDSQVQRSAIIDEFRINQDQELAVAASKFAECQKTIASLDRQLKSLAGFEDLLIDS